MGYLIFFLSIWALCVWASAVVTHTAEPYVDAAGDEHRYAWWMGALMGLLLGLFGFIGAAVYVKGQTPDGKPKVAIDYSPAPRRRRRLRRRR